MKVASRIGRETFVQTIGFGVQLVERILLAGILVRLWGVDDFAAWSLAISAAGMLALFDFGVNLYFANRILFLVQQKDLSGARAMLSAGNLLMGIASLVGLIAVAIGMAAYLRDGVAIGTYDARDIWIATMLLAGFAFLRASLTIQMSVYRAHEQFARQSVLWIVSDVLRVGLTLTVVLIGGSMIAAAAAQFVAGALFAAWLLLIEAPRRFPDFRYAYAGLARDDRRDGMTTSLGFWVQSAPNTALTYLPVMFLTAIAGPATIAQFVLMRTLSNFMRAALIPFSITLGQESARRRALSDLAGESSTYREATFLLAAIGAVPAGLLIAMGPDLFALWTGQPILYDRDMMLLAIAPPLLLPSLMMAQAYLSTANDPWPIAAARLAQVALTILVFVLLPPADPALRMFAALAIGEILGLALILSFRVSTRVAQTGVAFHLQMIGRMVLALAMTWGSASLASGYFSSLFARLAAGGIAGAVAGVIGIYLWGLTTQRRSAIHRILRRRLASA